MITLYDVVGAHPDDDAENLKNAFRSAVKTSHPDLHADDPNALTRFRQVVRANAILSDPNQRAIYDQMLEFERWQQRSKTKLRIVLDILRNLASDAIIVLILVVVLSGGYLTYVHLSKTPVTAVETMKITLPDVPSPPQQTGTQMGQLSREMVHELITGPGPVLAGPSVVPGATNETSPMTAPGARTEVSAPQEPVYSAKDEKLISSVAPAQSDKPAIESAAPPVAVKGKDGAEAEAAQIAGGGRAREPTPGDVANRDGKFETGDAIKNDVKPGESETGNSEIEGLKSAEPKFYRERGIASYRNGDLDRALADFNAAIRLDPASASAYIDRSMVLYRKAEFERAFADMAQASRIQESLRASPRHAAPPTPGH